MTYQGCYSSAAGLTDQGSYMYQTSGYCQPICVKQDQAVLATSGGSNCWCGDTLPPSSSKVADGECGTPCNGYGQENCGGTGFYSVYLSGTDASAPNAAGGVGGSSSSSSSASSSESSQSSAGSSQTTASPSSTTASPSVVTSIAPGATVIVTQPASPAASDNTSASQTSTTLSQSSSHPNIAGIAAGVVVGVLAAAALLGALIFLLKRRKQKAAEDEYKRSTQAHDFLRRGDEAEAKGPPMTGYSNRSDARLDPAAVGRVGRPGSAGSLGDEADYSRRILRVANPDGST
ncbi:WSC domain [Teratosphaeriaceae sp. CCFEE 6253]|nr:WSC domain [Teratosphaeriaceae sp. CCFEE 6253]